MKASYRVNDRLTVEVEASTQTELFAELAQLDEVFGDLKCFYNGKVSDEVRFVVREHEDNNFYEIVVSPTAAEKDLRYCKKQFGVHKKGGTLFPKKWENEQYWAKYDKTTGKMV
jgi:hypothetical protein